MDLAAASSDVARFLWAETASAEVYAEKSRSGMFPTARDIVRFTPLMVGALWVSKVVAEVVLLRPLARAMLGAKGVALPFESDKLEAIYLKHKPGVPDINEIKSLSKTLEKSVEQLNKWFRARQLADRDVVKVERCSESMWRLAMYSICFGANLSLMRGKPWVKDLSLSWKGIPFQEQEENVKLFFVGLEIPLYVVLLVSQLWDRWGARDMWEMTTHHALVLVMLCMLYLGNFCRIGMVGLALHDVTDLFLESSKLANLFRYRGIADLLFVTFAMSWMYARLYKFSATVHVSLYNHGRDVIGQGALNLTGALLSVLLLLNLFWGFKICSLMYRLFWGGVQKQRDRDMTDVSTDDDVDSDSSYLSDAAEPLRRHED